jgi:TetR/AcrR family transcriptional regulator, transcriptional repressor for nem operon
MGRRSDAAERLIDSAIALIPPRSYGAVSVDDLCAHAGVNKGSFYYFFPAKRDLALAAIERQWNYSQHHVLDPAVVPDIPPLERIRRLFRLAATLQSSGEARSGHVPGCPFGNLAAELGTQDAVIRDKVREVFAGFGAYFERVLLEAQAAGEIGSLDVPAAARGLVAYLEGALLLAKAYNDASMIDLLGQNAVSLVTGWAPAPPVAGQSASARAGLPDAGAVEADAPGCPGRQNEDVHAEHDSDDAPVQA